MRDVKGRILAVGLTCLDVVSYCSDGFPTEDSDTHCDEQRWSIGGNACNNVTVLRQLGADCQLVSSIADDPLTRALIDRLLTDVGVDHRSVFVRPKARQSISMVIVNEITSTRTIVHKRGTCEEPTADEFAAVIGDPSDYSWVHLEGRNFIETRKMLDYLLEAKRACLSTSFPTLSVELEKPRHTAQLETLVAGADVVFVSKDFAANKGFRNKLEAIDGLLNCLPSLAEGAIVICAWGETGAAAGRKRMTVGLPVDIVVCQAFPPAGGKVVDTLGAGDTFNAGVIFALNGGSSLLEAITFGCKLAGAKCGQRGLKNITMPAA